MREEIANIVYPIFNYGIRVKEQLASTRPPDFGTAQKELMALLQQPLAGHLATEFNGESPFMVTAGGGKSPNVFLGIRYGLVCWLDETFITDSPWRGEWNESKLESSMYNTNDRAYKFWDQARRAETRPTKDALEAYYLCVLLGFRGDLFQQPEKLRAWRESVEAQILHAEDRSYSPPPEHKIKPNVPLLLGAKRKQRMILTATIVMLILIPLTIFTLLKPF